MVSFLISWSCGFDPFGGFTLSGRSLAASGVGVLCAAPLIACSAFSRSRGARSAFPALDHLHQAQSDALQPLLANLTLPQAVILAAMQVPPTLMLLLPATHASTVTIGAALHSTLLSVFNDEHGLLLPEGACQLLSFLAPLSWLMLSGLAAASFASSAIGMRRQQLQSLQTAVRHADRFFRFKLGHELYTGRYGSRPA